MKKHQKFVEKANTALTQWFSFQPNLWKEDEYYRTKLASRNFITHADLVICGYLSKSFPIGTTVCEPGCGYGQLSLLLASVGFRCVGVDSAGTRHMGSIFLKERLLPLVGEVDFVEGIFPEVLGGRYFDVSVIGNIVNSGWHKWVSENPISKALNADTILIDTRTFGIIRDTYEQRKVLIGSIEEVGYEGTQLSGDTYVFRKRKGE